MHKLPTPLFVPVLPDPVMNDLLAFWQIELEKLSAERILHWVVDTFISQVAFAPSWTEEDVIIDSMIGKSAVPSVDLVHRLLLPETWAPLEPHETARPTFDGRAASVGLWTRFHVENLCKKQEKTIGRYQAWIVSVRRKQDVLLENMPVLSWSERFGVLRVAPLAAWSDEDVDRSLRHDGAACRNSGGVEEDEPRSTSRQELCFK